jgi:enamine deaminase RidA (YjgF/YER057c/UK114 family)
MAETRNSRKNISSGGAYEGIFGYSRAVRVGDQVHVSGTCAPPAHEHDDAYNQARAALAVIGRALEEGPARGSRMWSVPWYT